MLSITFSRFGADGDSDKLTVYDGNSISAPLIGTYNVYALQQPYRAQEKN
ncbi:MAG: hypothetical protein WDO15_26555 [Bacteroidota bacterium]